MHAHHMPASNSSKGHAQQVPYLFSNFLSRDVEFLHVRCLIVRTCFKCDPNLSLLMYFESLVSTYQLWLWYFINCKQSSTRYVPCGVLLVSNHLSFAQILTIDQCMTIYLRLFFNVSFVCCWMTKLTNLLQKVDFLACHL